MSAEPTRTPRTLRLDDTLIVVDYVRAARLEPRYAPASPDDQLVTIVYLHGAEYPVSISGDHVDTISKAVEARELRPC